MTMLYWYLLPLLPLGAAGLWLAYRRRGRGQPRVVSSVFLLKKLAQISTARARFVPPLRFYVELLAVLLLGGAAIGLGWSEDGPKIALVIDNSLSTASQPSGGGATDSLGARTAFEEIVRSAKGELLKFPDNSRISLFTTAPRLEQLGGRSLGVGAAAEALNSARWRYASDSLISDLQRLALEGRFDRIVLITDRRATSGERGPAQVEYITPPDLHAPLQNIALESLSVQRAGREARAHVRVHSYASSAVRGDVAVEGVSREGSWSELQRRSFEVDPNESEEIELAWLDIGTEGVRARLELSTSLRSDALSEDNIGFAIVGGSQGDIVVYSDLTPSQLGLDDLPLFKTVHGVDDQRDSSDSTPRAFIFHRRAVETLPRRPALFVLPPGDGVFRLAGDLGPMELVRWDEMHPLMHYLNLPLLSLSRVGAIVGPVWSEDIVRGSKGALVRVGEHEGNRFVAVGFEVFPYEGSRSPVLSVFLLNALRWLVGEQGGNTTPLTENSISLPENASQVTYVDGEALPIDGRGAHPRVVAPHPGILRVKANGDREVQIAVNPQILGESDLRLATLPVIPVPPPSTHLSGDSLGGGIQASSSIPLLAALALVLMIFDLVLITRSRIA